MENNFFKWCKDNYKLLIAVGAFLAIISFILQIIQAVGITINIPLYFSYFHNEFDIDLKLYILSSLNLLFSIFIYLILSKKIKIN